tara:strand:+ start:2739 stop:3332 length:594 start_codon:yes stop_codon:yes gene_type:complete
MRQSAQAASSNTGGSFMKFTKFGTWEFGVDSIEIEDGSQWAINPTSFKHGWIAWGDKSHGTEGQKLGEVMVSANEPFPPQPEPVKGDWHEQFSFQMACVSGEDEGAQVQYGTSSSGGKKFYHSVVNAVCDQIDASVAEVVPVVTLGNDSYTHQTYGKIFNPDYEVVKFVTLDGAAAEEPEPEPEPEPEAPKRRRRRK